MPFSNLRANNNIYILHKDKTPYLEIGNVISVSAPMPIIGAYGQSINMSVDVLVRVGEQNINYSKLPSNADVADWGGNGNLVIAATRDAMNGELNSMKQKSNEVLNSVEYHKGVLEVVDRILQQINPEYAQNAQQQAEINTLKAELSTMSEKFDMLLEQLKGEKAGRSSKKTES